MRSVFRGLHMHEQVKSVPLIASVLLACLLSIGCLAGCSGSTVSASDATPVIEPTDKKADSADADAAEDADAEGESDEGGAAGEEAEEETEAAPAAADIAIAEDYRPSFVHGDKPAEYQKYIVLHDTEGGGDAYGVIDSWDSTGKGVASHFIVNKDGSIVQCVPLENIAHHAGYGDAGHNDLYGIVEDGRDDMVGSEPIGDWAPDYGMNAWSVGIEIVHIGGEGAYPEEQLSALDGLIAHIDAYYGFESAIIDHKAWRSGNSDTSPEFAECLANYQDHRTHN